MSYLGQVKNGVIVLEGEMPLAEGTRVRIELIEEEPEPSLLVEQLMDWAGKGKDLPEDLARNHDHYLHGQPRQ
jgi:hypothetical protein